MPLYGTLKTMPLPDLLQWLGSARKTGTLQVESNRVQKWILLKDGQVLGCSSDDPPERLGQFLLSRGKITENQLRIALAAQEGAQRHLGKICVEMGAISLEELSSLLEAKAEETIYSLFDWEDAVFRFHEELTDHANIFPVNLRVEDILLRGLKRYDEVQRIRSVLNDPGIVLRHTARTPPAEILDNKMARTLYEAINGDRTVAEILLHVHGSEYLVTKFLYELHRSEFLEIAGVKRVETSPLSSTAGVARPGPATDAGVPEPVAPEAPIRPAPTPAAPAAVGVSPSATATAVRPEPVATTPQPAVTAPAAPHVPAPAPVPETAETEQDFDAEDDEFLDIPDVFCEDSDVEAVEDSESYQLNTKLEHARRLMAANEHDTALEVLAELYRTHPDDDSLRRLTTEAETAFIARAYQHYVPAHRFPVLTRPIESLEAENLSPTEFFLLSRIDGTWDVKSIIQIAPIREVEALLTLKRMREKGVIDLIEPDTGSKS